MPKYIEQRRRIWYAVLQVPKDVREHYNGSRLVVSLKTESKTEAERLVLSVVAKWKDEFEVLRSGGKTDTDLLARTWAPDYESASPDKKEIYDDLLEEKAREISIDDPNLARAFVKIVQGESVSLLDHVDEWLSTKELASKTHDTYRANIVRLAEEFPYTHNIDRRAVKAWALDLQVKENLNRNTVQRLLSIAKGYWMYLDQRGHIRSDTNPFEKALSSQKHRTKGTRQPLRQPFDPSDIPKLVEAASVRDDTALTDLITLGAWTGCRIEELCSLKLTNVTHDRLIIVDAKTKAGNRIIPVHQKLSKTVSRLSESSEDGYLLSGLTFNSYDHRSNALGKRFGRLKSDLGFGPEHVFHSIRKTVATMLENAGVPENIAADIIGHEKQTMTYGLYSGGASFDTLCAALGKLDYDGL